MHTKSECWKYEKEHRLFIDQNICFTRQIGGKLFHFVKIPKENLVRIDLCLKFEQNNYEELSYIVKELEYSKVKYIVLNLINMNIKLITT